MGKCESCIHEKTCVYKANIQTDTYAYMHVKYDTEKCERYAPSVVKINLNETVKFKLTDHGKDIYYHQYDELNERIKARGGKPLEPRMPRVDADGYTEMQLWYFIELYGNHIGMTKPNVIEPLDIIIEKEKNT